MYIYIIYIYIYIFDWYPFSCPVIPPRCQTQCNPALLLPWYLGRACCRPSTPRRRLCRRPPCRRLPPRSRATRLSQFPPHHSLLSLSVSSSPPPIRSRDTTRACHHIGILAECTRACDPYAEGLQSRIQPQDTCARGYSDILFHGHI
jgi:hypothetical protein